MRSSRQNLFDLKSMVLDVVAINFLQCLSKMSLELRRDTNGRMVFMFFTLSVKLVNDFQVLISLLDGA
jgi:hypothetical protein